MSETHTSRVRLVRGSPQDFLRCEDCRMHRRLCICEFLPKIVTNSRLVLLIHYKEIKRPSNTGLLATKCVKNSEVIVRGQPDHSVEKDGLSHLGDHELLWLFPSKEAVPLSKSLIKDSKKPIALLVPDGNWGQAARIPRRFHTPTHARNVFLPQACPTEYKLRRELGRPEGLGTIEAISRALSIIEDNEEINRQMIYIMRLMVNRTLWSRGTISTKQAKKYLPESLFSEIANCNQ